MLNENLIQVITDYATALEQKLSALEARVGSLQLTVDSLQGAVDSLQAENETLKAELANISTNNHQPSTDLEPEVEIELIVEEEPQEQETLEEPEQQENLEEIEESPTPEPVIELEPEAEPEPVVEQPVVVEQPAPAAPKVEQRPMPQQTSLFGTMVEDIRQAISLGDRFLFQRELFAGNGELMQKTLDELNALGSLEEAMDYVADNFEWDSDSTAVQLFENVLKRRFAN